MKNILARGVILFIFLTSGIEAAKSVARPSHTESMQEECHELSKETYEFGQTLSETNRKMFCSKFNDAQRNKAIEMSKANPLFTSDQSVEKTAKENNLSY